MKRTDPAPKAVYSDPTFLDAQTCGRIRDAMDRGRVEAAEVLDHTIEHQDDVRRAAYVDVDARILAEIESRLDAQRDAIGAFFGVTLTGREGAGFVRYPEGGFYKPHRDRADLPSWPDARRRQIAVVIFLNSSRESVPDGAFAGGILRLLAGDAVDLVPTEGTLVAFPADVLHEVTIVRRGTRDAIVDWFVE